MEAKYGYTCPAFRKRQETSDFWTTYPVSKEKYFLDSKELVCPESLSKSEPVLFIMANISRL